jgi:hypothetical protein
VAAVGVQQLGESADLGLPALERGHLGGVAQLAGHPCQLVGVAGVGRVGEHSGVVEPDDPVT